jgi:hypothetical protein
VTSVSARLRAMIGYDAAEIISRRRMAILLTTLVLLVLATPIADVVRETRLVIAAGTVGFLLSCLQQVDNHPRLRPFSRLMVLLWLILSLPLPWSAGIWVTSAAAAILAALTLSILWLVARDLIGADRIDAELLCSAVGAYLLLGVFWVSIRIQLRPPFRVQSRPLLCMGFGLIHVVHRRDPRPALRAPQRWPATAVGGSCAPTWVSPGGGPGEGFVSFGF